MARWGRWKKTLEGFGKLVGKSRKKRWFTISKLMEFTNEKRNSWEKASNFAIVDWEHEEDHLEENSSSDDEDEDATENAKETKV